MIDHQMQRFINVHESLDSPPGVSLCSLHDGSLIMSFYEQQTSTLPKVKKLQLEPRKICQIHTKHGIVLYGALYKPDEENFGPPPYKTMISVYGGPGVWLVSDSWANMVDMRAQFLRSKGILVWKMDNRGSSRRGLAFEGAMKHNFGRFDGEDQVAGVEWLMKEGLAKAGDIGVYGWSYGGYLSAVDENMHFRHTARLLNALVGAGKVYELLIFPDARHMPRPLMDLLYMEERIWDFIQRSL